MIAEPISPPDSPAPAAVTPVHVPDVLMVPADPLGEASPPTGAVVPLNPFSSPESTPEKAPEHHGSVSEEEIEESLLQEIRNEPERLAWERKERKLLELALTKRLQDRTTVPNTNWQQMIRVLLEEIHYHEERVRHNRGPGSIHSVAHDWITWFLEMTLPTWSENKEKENEVRVLLIPRRQFRREQGLPTIRFQGSKSPHGSLRQLLQQKLKRIRDTQTPVREADLLMGAFGPAELWPIDEEDKILLETVRADASLTPAGQLEMVRRGRKSRKEREAVTGSSPVFVTPSRAVPGGEISKAKDSSGKLRALNAALKQAEDQEALMKKAKAAALKSFLNPKLNPRGTPAPPMASPSSSSDEASFNTPPSSTSAGESSPEPMDPEETAPSVSTETVRQEATPPAAHISSKGKKIITSKGKQPRKSAPRRKLPVKLPGSQKICKALREIRHYQKTVDPVMPHAPFYRLVRELLQEIQPEFRLGLFAVHALQEAAEAYMVQLIEQAYLCSIHAGRVTLQPKDIQLAQRIREGL